MSIDLNNKLLSLVERLRTHKNAEGISLDFTPAPTPVHVNCAIDEIEKILELLITFSILNLRNKKEYIEVKLDVTPDVIDIIIADTGDGLRSSSGLFDIFHRSGLKPFKTITEMDQNLLLADEISKRIKSKIWVESKWGTGTTFHLEIPLNSVSSNSATVR